MKDTDDSIKPSGDNDEKEELKEIVENLENVCYFSLHLL